MIGLNETIGLIVTASFVLTPSVTLNCIPIPSSTDSTLLTLYNFEIQSMNFSAFLVYSKHVLTLIIICSAGTNRFKIGSGQIGSALNNN